MSWEPCEHGLAGNCLQCSVAELRREIAAVTADITHAVSEAKRREPEYPWQLNTASEAVWALGESLNGTRAANDDLHRTLAAVTASRDAEVAKVRRERDIEVANIFEHRRIAEERLAAVTAQRDALLAACVMGAEVIRRGIHPDAVPTVMLTAMAAVALATKGE